VEGINTAAIVLAIIAVALVIDRALLAAERRGWIYWRRKKASPGTAAAAFMEIHSMVDPGRSHAADAIRAEEPEEDDEGDDVDSRGESRDPSGDVTHRGAAERRTSR